jgi:hypothetical protein
MFDVTVEKQDLKKNGVWAEFEGGEFLIAYASKMSFQREIARLQQPYVRQIQNGKLDPKISLDIVAKAMSRHLLLGWRSVGSSGKELEYSTETAEKVLRANDGLRTFVSDFSIDLDNFKREVEETEGKSS